MPQKTQSRAKGRKKVYNTNNTENEGYFLVIPPREVGKSDGVARNARKNQHPNLKILRIVHSIKSNDAQVKRNFREYFLASI